jgi:hypothetical protein
MRTIPDIYICIFVTGGLLLAQDRQTGNNLHAAHNEIGRNPVTTGVHCQCFGSASLSRSSSLDFLLLAVAWSLLRPYQCCCCLWKVALVLCLVAFGVESKRCPNPACLSFRGSPLRRKAGLRRPEAFKVSPAIAARRRTTKKVDRGPCRQPRALLPRSFRLQYRLSHRDRGLR